MGVKAGPCLVLRIIEHVAGTPYPVVDFSKVADKIDMTTKAKNIACTNEELEQLIMARRLLTGAERVAVAYYDWE